MAAAKTKTFFVCFHVSRFEEAFNNAKVENGKVGGCSMVLCFFHASLRVAAVRLLEVRPRRLKPSQRTLRLQMSWTQRCGHVKPKKRCCDLIDLALKSMIFLGSLLAHHLDSAKVSAQLVSQDLLAVLSQVASYDSDSRLEFVSMP